MATYRKNGDGSTDLPLDDGTTVAVLGRVVEVGPMYRVVVLGGPYDGRHFTLFGDEVEPERR